MVIDKYLPVKATGIRQVLKACLSLNMSYDTYEQAKAIAKPDEVIYHIYYISAGAYHKIKISNKEWSHEKKE